MEKTFLGEINFCFVSWKIIGKELKVEVDKKINTFFLSFILLFSSYFTYSSFLSQNYLLSALATLPLFFGLKMLSYSRRKVFFSAAKNEAKLMIGKSVYRTLQIESLKGQKLSYFNPGQDGPQYSETYVITCNEQRLFSTSNSKKYQSLINVIQESGFKVEQTILT